MNFKQNIVFLIVLCLVSCDFILKKETTPEAIARVGEEYLYQSDIQGLIPEGTSEEDSILIVKTHIERWATQKLLTQTSEINLSETQRKEFEKLVEKYKIDLYTNAYMEQLVKAKIDTVITKEELEACYNENKSNLRTNSRLVKLRYVKVPAEHQKLDEIKKRFFNPKKADSTFWNTHLVQLQGGALNDSVWVDINQIYQKIPFINPSNADNYVKNGKIHQYQDEENVYYVVIKSVLPANEISPLDYIEPTVRQVILNKRKLEFIKKIEREIIEDALKNNNYEIYK